MRWLLALLMALAGMGTAAADNPKAEMNYIQCAVGIPGSMIIAGSMLDKGLYNSLGKGEELIALVNAYCRNETGYRGKLGSVDELQLKAHLQGVMQGVFASVMSQADDLVQRQKRLRD